MTTPISNPLGPHNITWTDIVRSIQTNIPIDVLMRNLGFTDMKTGDVNNYLHIFKTGVNSTNIGRVAHNLGNLIANTETLRNEIITKMKLGAKDSFYIIKEGNSLFLGQKCYGNNWKLWEFRTVLREFKQGIAPRLDYGLKAARSLSLSPREMRFLTLYPVSSFIEQTKSVTPIFNNIIGMIRKVDSRVLAGSIASAKAIADVTSILINAFGRIGLKVFMIVPDIILQILDPSSIYRGKEGRGPTA